MIIVTSLVHPCKLCHVYESSIKNDLGLGICFRANELVCLDAAFCFESRQQVNSLLVDVAKDNTLVPLAVS